MAKGAGVWVRFVRERNGWRTVWREEPHGVLHGSRIYRELTEAEAMADALRGRITTRRRSVRDAIEDWKADMAARAERGEMRRETGPHEAGRVLKLCAGALDLPLSNLTARKAGELYVAYAEQDGVSAGTNHRALRACKAWASFCCKRGWFKVNPFTDVETMGAAADLRDVCLRVDEARAYMQTAKDMVRAGDGDALAPLLCLMVSLLPSEIVQIVARDVDDGGRILWVAGATLKTRNRRRKMVIQDEDLQQFLAARAEGKDRDARLFSPDKELVTASVRRVAAAAKVPTVGARELRRTFATLDAQSGSSLGAVAFNLGHGSDGKAQTAKKHYIAHGAAQSGAARRVLSVLDGGAKPAKRAK